MEHPPYSPDLAPHDFWLYPKIKSLLKGQRFQDIEDIKIITTALIDIPQQWQNNWAKCIVVQG
jgi:hypothetical protein